MKEGVRLIQEERDKHKELYDYDEEHDDEYKRGELISAAMLLLTNGWKESNMSHSRYQIIETLDKIFPWDYIYKRRFLKKTPEDSLIVAGALIAAELDRLQREKK